MTCLFADLSIAAAAAALVSLTKIHFPQHHSSYRHRISARAMATASAIAVARRTAALPDCGMRCSPGCRGTKQQPLARSLHPAVLPTSRHAQRHVDDLSRGGAQPMKHLDPKKTNRRPAPTAHVFSPVALRSVATGSCWATGIDSCTKPSRSRPTIQVLFCVSEMWRRHAGPSMNPSGTLVAIP